MRAQSFNESELIYRSVFAPHLSGFIDGFSTTAVRFTLCEWFHREGGYVTTCHSDADRALRRRGRRYSCAFQQLCRTLPQSVLRLSTTFLGWVRRANNSSTLGQTGWFQGNPGVFPAQAGAGNSYVGANFLNAAGGGTSVIS